MVLSLVTLAATVPLLATSTLQMQNQAQTQQEEIDLERKTEKCHLTARATERMSAKHQEQFRDMRVVLYEGRLFLEPRARTGKHPMAAYLLPFPEQSYDGIVSTINTDNMLNWIYIDKKTYRLRYGVRAVAEQHLIGPMTLVAGCDEWRVAFNGWEGFAAVQKGDSWTLYFDKDDDGLAHSSHGNTVVEVELIRIALEETKTSDDPD